MQAERCCLDNGMELSGARWNPAIDAEKLSTLVELRHRLLAAT